MDSLIKNKIWILVNRPKNQIMVNCKWVYTIKEDESNVENKIYIYIYIIIILLALTTHFDWGMDQFDVKATFLNGDMDELIYMSQPRGFEVEFKI